MNNLQSLSINGIQLHWLEKGEGEPLILMPGAIGDFLSWTNQMDEFSRHFRTIALSRRYEFPSKYVKGGDGSMDPCISDLLGLIAHLNLKKVSLVGHSFGGYICLAFTHRYPHLVNRLVLEEPTIFPYITNNPKNPLKLLPLAFNDFGAALSFLKWASLASSPVQKLWQNAISMLPEWLFSTPSFQERCCLKMPTRFYSNNCSTTSRHFKEKTTPLFILSKRNKSRK
ncbi:MAG: alpha/beta hydrolase [Saprospiraceae bacterium]|nr:alpha/beta hydrolase [Candidatus Defluviibacterium haderslevense]